MTPQKAVNGTAQETVDTLDYVVQSVVSIWGAIPLGVQAFLLTVFALSLLMEWVKRALLAEKLKRERIRLLWLSSFPLGAALAALGWYLTGRAIEPVYWAVIGLTAGTAAMAMHWVTVKKLLPLLGLVWGRVMLAVRGHA